MNPRSPRILLVEDSPTDAKLLERWLRLADFSFSLEIIRDGEAARRRLTAANGEPFDLVLLDQNLPGCSGTEILAAARSVMDPEREPLGPIPFIVFHEPHDGQATESPGCRFLRKPRTAEEYDALVKLIRESTNNLPETTSS